MQSRVLEFSSEDENFYHMIFVSPPTQQKWRTSIIVMFDVKKCETRKDAAPLLFSTPSLFARNHIFRSTCHRDALTIHAENKPDGGRTVCTLYAVPMYFVERNDPHANDGNLLIIFILRYRAMGGENTRAMLGLCIASIPGTRPGVEDPRRSPMSR